MTEKALKKVTSGQGFLLLGLVAGFIIISARLGANSTMYIALTWLIIYLFCVIFKLDYNAAQKAAFDSIRKCMGALFILICVGMLVGAWIAAGTIPSLISYGLSVISPKVFLLCSLLITSIMSVCTGTSYGSAASAGVAMMGIGLSMGIPAGAIGGSIICGAVFGDKLSPMSDTTNVCPALCGGDLFLHIKSQLYTTTVPYIICVVFFTILGFRYASTGTFDTTTMNNTIAVIGENFKVSPITLIPLVLVIVLLMVKVDVVPTIIIGAVTGMLIAILYQGSNFVSMMGVLWNGYSISTGDFIVDKLLNRGGIVSMNSTVIMMMFAIGMGAMLEHLGVMDVFMNILLKKIDNVFKLVGATMIVSYLGGALTTAMTSANVLTGKLMSPLYKEKGIAPEVCSRTMEDTGTIGGPLMPWHSNSIYYMGVLGVTWAEFAPYLVLNYTVPVFSLICAATGIGIFYVNKQNERISKEEWAKLYADDKSFKH